jgi:hypothetical protein
MRHVTENRERGQTPRNNARGTVRLLLTTTLALLVIASGTILAGTESSARSAAMGGAFTGLASGVDAGKYNPANLGLTDYQITAVEIAGLGVNINNNAFTLDDYNKYTGAFLTDADKEYILGRIPAEGLLLKADVEASAASVAFGSMAFNVIGVGIADINLSRDIFELVLNGNTYADTIDVTGSYSDAYSYVSAGLSYGTPVYNAGTRQLAVGATFKYIRGIAVEEVVELEGMAATMATGFEGSGRLIARTASGGRGYGLDLGAALQLNRDYTVGARVENLLGSIRWDNKTEEHGYIFNFDTMTVDNMDEDYVTSDDYKRDIGSFSTSLPRVLTLGAAKTSGRLLLAVDWEQGLERKAGSSTTPLISLGAEYRLFSFMPLRAGFRTGGKRNTTVSFGSGFSYNPVHIDFAIATGNSLTGGSAKGANFALTLGLAL